MYHNTQISKLQGFLYIYNNGFLEFAYDWASRVYPFNYQIPSLLIFHFFNKEYPETVLYTKEMHGLITSLLVVCVVKTVTMHTWYISCILVNPLN